MKKLPLENIRILDFTHVWAGPMMAGTLGDMGAEVIKVESRTRLDLWRTRPGIAWKDLPYDKFDLCPGFHNVNANKMSLTLNLKKPESIEIIHKLAAHCDVVCENMTAGTMSKLGIGYEDLKKEKEDIIYISSCAFGQKGELSRLPGYGPTMQAMSGFDYTLGYHGERPLGLFAVPFSDGNAGTQSILAVLAALYYRKKTGKGIHLDCSQVEGLMDLVGYRTVSAAEVENFSPDGNHSPVMAPYNFYPVSGDDDWVSIAVASEEEWKSLCEAAGHSEWATDPRFCDMPSRVANSKELDKLLSAWTKNYTAEDLTALLRARNLAVAPLTKPQNFEQHPFFRDRGTFVKTVHSAVGEETLFGSPWQIEGVSREVRLPSPMMGEHNEKILSSLLGMSKEEIDRLTEEQVLY